MLLAYCGGIESAAKPASLQQNLYMLFREGNHMNSKRTHFLLAAVALFASTQLAAAQGTSGGTGAIASIPGSVVRGHEQGRGLVSVIAGSTLPQPDVSKQAMTRRRESPTPPK
jgi:hypothetical protein